MVKATLEDKAGYAIDSLAECVKLMAEQLRDMSEHQLNKRQRHLVFDVLNVYLQSAHLGGVSEEYIKELKEIQLRIS